MRKLIPDFILGLLFHGSALAFPGSPDASAAVTDARPGFVRHASGDPVVLGAGRRQSEPLAAGRRLKSGEQVHAQPGDRVEIFLSANSCLRVAENTEIEVMDTAYTEMRFRVVQGTVIIESASLNPSIHSLALSAPPGDLQIETKGLYRLDVLPGRESAVSISMDGQDEQNCFTSWWRRHSFSL